MIDAGLGVSDDCLAQYNEVRNSKKLRYVIYKNVNNKSIEVEKVGERAATYQNFVDSLPDSDSRYCVFDYHIDYPDGRQTDKIVYIFWCPDNASVKTRMVSASMNQMFLNKLQGIAVSFQCNDISMLEVAEIEKKLK